MIKFEKNERGVVTGIKGIGKLVASVVLGIILFVSALGSFYINGEYEQAIVTHLGEYHDSTGPGLHWKVPFVQSVFKADTRMREFKAQQQVVATKSGETITLDIVINHQIDKNNVERLYREFGQKFDYEGRILANLAIDRIKGIIGQHNIEEFIPNRGDIRMNSLNVIREEMTKYGVVITDTQFPNYELDPRFKSRLDSVANSRAAAAAAEQDYRRQEFETKTKIEAARATTESQKLAADANAHKIRVESEQNSAAISREGEARASAELAVALAKAEGMRKQLEALNARGGNALIELTRAEATKNWNGVYNPQIVMGSSEGGNIPFLPILDVNQQMKQSR